MSSKVFMMVSNRGQKRGGNPELLISPVPVGTILLSKFLLQFSWHCLRQYDIQLDRKGPCIPSF